MLKTNSKQAKENIKLYIMEHFDCDGYDVEKIPDTFESIAKFILNTFKSEKYSRIQDFKYYNYNGHNNYSKNTLQYRQQ